MPYPGWTWNSFRESIPVYDFGRRRLWERDFSSVADSQDACQSNTFDGPKQAEFRVFNTVAGHLTGHLCFGKDPQRM